jgi:hypothetical protein
MHPSLTWACRFSACLFLCRSLCGARPRLSASERTFLWNMCKEISLYWSHNSCKCFLLDYLQIHSFLPGIPYTYAQHNINKQTNTFPHLSLKPTKHYSLMTHIQEGTKQNCRPHRAQRWGPLKLQCSHIHCTFVNRTYVISSKGRRTCCYLQVMWGVWFTASDVQMWRKVQRSVKNTSYQKRDHWKGALYKQ